MTTHTTPRTRWQLPDVPDPSDGRVPYIDGSTWLTAARIASAGIGLSASQMIENAGHELAAFTRLTLGGVLRSRRIVVMTGTGNNAGAGMVAARRLAGWGADVRAIFAKPILRLRPAPCAQLEAMLAAGVDAAVAGHDRSYLALRREVEQADAVIDALIGTSLRGAPDAMVQPLIELAGVGQGAVISLEMPTGIAASSGARPDFAVSADATLALALPKWGISIGQGVRHAGTTYLADVGIPASVFVELGFDARGMFDGGPLLRLGQARICGRLTERSQIPTTMSTAPRTS